MSITYGGSNITFPDGSTQNTSPQTGFVNRIINGDMRIDQRNAGASVSFSTATRFPTDRWNGYSDQANSTGQSSTIAPTGFINSLAITVGTGSPPSAGQVSRLEQRIEGLNVFDLGFGTAAAQPVTISFWVRSSVTGTHSGVLSNVSGNRSYPFTFVITSANTWEYETVTIPGDTSGTWTTDNSTGMKLMFNFGTGSTYLGTAGAWAGATLFGATGSVQLTATTGATFYITGVSLVKGSTALPWEFRSIGQELALCQRYYQVVAFVGTAVTTGEMGATGVFKVTMRTPPSLNSALRHPPSYNSSNNQIVSYGVGPVNVGSAAFSSVSADFFGAILCTGLAVGAVYGGSTTASAEL